MLPPAGSRQQQLGAAGVQPPVQRSRQKLGGARVHLALHGSLQNAGAPMLPAACSRQRQPGAVRAGLLHLWKALWVGRAGMQVPAQHSGQQQ